MAIDSFARLAALHDNYIPDVHKAEKVTPEMLQEQQSFVDVVMKSQEMALAYNLLNSKGVYDGSYEEFGSYVHKIWFGLYDRDGTSARVLDSS